MIKAIVGANWGDEGKGKITDVFAQDADIVVRFQGGNNAGHTIINDYGKFSLHMLPSGVFSKNTVNVIGNGVAFNIPAFIEELKLLDDANIPTPTIYVSDRVQLVMPYHILFDELEEARRGKNSFGSTKSGIAPFYSDKFAKIGFQLNEIFNEDVVDAKLDNILVQKNALLEHVYHAEPLCKETLKKTIAEYLELIKPYVKDTVKYLNEAYREGKTILMEGQLGSLRDPEVGIYPYSTSSNTIAPYAAVGSGLPYQPNETYAITKAYSSCVGAGPFVSEIFDDEANELRKRGGDAGEYGATTGRPRRVGWFDCIATRYGCFAQGATDVVMTNIDVLSYLDEIPVCVGYKHKETNKIYDYFPNTNILNYLEPIIEVKKGWKVDITGVTDYNELPELCKEYIDFIEKKINHRITLISNGPKRSQIMKRESKI